MDQFQQKIYELTEKLQSLAPKHVPSPPSISELHATLSSFEERIQQQKQELERRSKCLTQTLNLYEQQLGKISSKYSEKTDIMLEQHLGCIEEAKKNKQQKLEEVQRTCKMIQCEYQETMGNERCQFEIRVKMLKKQIEKELALFQKQLTSLNNPEQPDQKSKIYKQYLQKITVVEQNQRKKAEKINQLQKKVQKRIIKLYNNTSAKISNQEKQLRSKYEKIKRLFTLVADI